MKRTVRLLSALTLAAPLTLGAVALTGCNDTTDTASTKDCSTVVSATADATTNHDNIQTALEMAKPGDQVCLKPGTYPLAEEISLATDNITLRGTGGGDTILDFNGQTSGANGITVTSVKGFKIADLTVKNTAGDSIKVTQSTDVVFLRVKALWDTAMSMKNGAYGLYPVQSTNVLIDSCVVSGASDAGIYVGQSNNVIVRDSEAYGNVAGIEIENTTNSEVVNNYAHDNTGGILVFNLPDLTQYGSKALVHKNRVEKNNGFNFSDPSGTVHIVPSGTGILVLACDQNEITDNDVKDNDSVGIAIASYLITGKEIKDEHYDPFPQNNYVHSNRLSGNGETPDGLVAQISAATSINPIPDLLWDGLVNPAKNGKDPDVINCWKDNGDATFLDVGIDATAEDPTDFKGWNPSQDIGPYTCEKTPLPTITLNLE